MHIYRREIRKDINIQDSIYIYISWIYRNRRCVTISSASLSLYIIIRYSVLLKYKLKLLTLDHFQWMSSENKFWVLPFLHKHNWTDGIKIELVRFYNQIDWLHTLWNQISNWKYNYRTLTNKQKTRAVTCSTVSTAPQAYVKTQIKYEKVRVV